MRIIGIRKIRGTGLTKKQKIALGTTAALLGVAGLAGAAHYNQPKPTNLDRAMKDLAAQQLNQVRDDSFQPKYNRGEARNRLHEKSTAISAMLAKQQGLPPARSYDEIMGIKELPGDSSKLRPDQLRRRPVKR